MVHMWSVPIRANLTALMNSSCDRLLSRSRNVKIFNSRQLSFFCFFAQVSRQAPCSFFHSTSSFSSARVLTAGMAQISNGLSTPATPSAKSFHNSHFGRKITMDTVNSHTQQDPQQFLEKLVKLIRENGLLGGTDRSKKVVEFKHPSELQDIFDLNVGPHSSGEEELLSLCQDVIRYSVHTNHPFFRNQLYGGVDPYGLAGAWLTEVLNTNQYTYEVAPIFSLVEHTVIQLILRSVCFQDGDGIFAPGGSMSNMYGMVLARYKAFPEIKTAGLSGLPPLTVFTSDGSHYSIGKGAHWLGLGTDHVIKVPSDAAGKMDPVKLDALITESKGRGEAPFFVNATAGTTVLGSFDPFEDIAKVCQKHGIWLHVDACWGGSLLFSKKYRHVLSGIECADSVAWNPHKMLGAPLQCSVFVVKEKGLLHCCNSAAARYLFQQDKFYDVSWDTGDKSVQCGRKVDAFKLWLMWKARGSEGLEELVDNAMDCSRYFLKKISGRPGFRLVLKQPECSNVCFWFIPPSLRNLPETEEWWKRLETVAPLLKEKMVKKGSLMVGYSPLPSHNLSNFLRLVVTCQPPPKIQDMDFIINEIEQLGADI